MKTTDLANAVRDAANVQRVFGDAYERGEVSVIPVARLGGGGGGGGGHDQQGQEGEGGGFGVGARPAGVFLVTDRGARWVPAVDVTRIVTVVGAVVVAVLFTRALVERARIRAGLTQASGRSAGRRGRPGRA